MIRNKLGVAAFMAVATAMVVASAAWACTSQARSFALDGITGPRGSEVTATGEAVLQDTAPMTIRWNSVSGPVLAEVTSSYEFSVPLTIPDAEPGVYYLVAVSGDTAMARAAFEVTGDAAPGSVAPVSAWSQQTNFDPAPSSSGGSSPTLVAGMVLLGLGTAGLFAGFGVAASRRRRAPVRAPQR